METSLFGTWPLWGYLTAVVAFSFFATWYAHEKRWVMFTINVVFLALNFYRAVFWYG